MKATATTQIQNKAFSGVENHVEHKEKQKHSNQNINSLDTKFNQEVSAPPEYIKKITEQTFRPELEIYNQKQINSRHQNRVKTLAEYTKNKKWSKRAIATFGNSELQKELLAGKNETEKAELLQKESTGLINYAKQFNRLNSNFKLFKAVTNVDENKEEIGAPHVHLDVRPFSKTGTGKASMSINNALKAEFKHDNPKEEIPTDTRQLMSWWREKNDQLLVKEMSKSLGINFTLERKERDPKEMGLSQTEFQKRQDHKKEDIKLLAQIEPEATIKWQKIKAKKRLKLNQLELKKDKIKPKMHRQVQFLLDLIKRVVAFEKKLKSDLKNLENKLTTNENSWFSDEMIGLNEQENDLKQQENELDEKLKNLELNKPKSQTKAQLIAKMHQMNQQKKDQDLLTKLKQRESELNEQLINLTNKNDVRDV